MREGNGSVSQDKQTLGLNRDGLAKLPEGWEWARIGDLALGDIQTGPFGAQLHRSEFVLSGIPVLAIGNVKWGYVDLSEIEHVTAEKAEQLQRYVLRAGDVLFTRSGTVGRSAVLPQEADGYLMTGHILRIRLNPEIYLPELLFRAFRGEPTMERQLQGHTRGMTRAGFNTSLLSDLIVPVPPPAEQRRIVAKIKALQERSQRARKVLAEVGSLLEQFRQSVLAAAFRGDLTARWRSAHPNVEPASELLCRLHAERRHRWEQAELAKYEAKGQKPPKNWQDKYEEPEPVEDSTLPELPEEWVWSTLETISVIQGGLTLGQKKRTGVQYVSVPYLRVANVQRGHLDLSEVKTIEVTLDGLEQLRLQDGDLLFNEGGDRDKLGRGWIWKAEIEDCIHQNHVFRARLFSSELIPALISYYANEFGREFFFRRASQTVNLASINKTQLSRLPIPVIPLQEQQVLVALLDEVLGVARALQDQGDIAVSELDQLDQSILAKAFRGELVPQDPNDEPASTLLTRIREQRMHQAETAKYKQKTSKQRGNKRSEESSRLTPQQLTLAEVLLTKD